MDCSRCEYVVWKVRSIERRDCATCSRQFVVIMVALIVLMVMVIMLIECCVRFCGILKF
jgi:hypothetical protein